MGLFCDCEIFVSFLALVVCHLAAEPSVETFVVNVPQLQSAHPEHGEIIIWPLSLAEAK